MLNNQDINNLLALIKVTPITGEQALTVAVLQDKLTKMLVSEQEPVETSKKNV